MTIMRTLIVACDAPECADDEGYIATAYSHTEARAEAAQHGWTVRLGRDFCPKHLDRPANVRHTITGTVHGTVIQAGNIAGGVRL